MKSKLRLISFIAIVITLLCCTKQLDDSIIDFDIDELSEEPLVDLEEGNSISNLVITNELGEEIGTASNISDNVIIVKLPTGTNVTDLYLEFTKTDTATILQSTQSVDFSDLSIRLFTVVAENGDTNTYAVKITAPGIQEPDDRVLSGEFAITSVLSITNGLNEAIIFDNDDVTIDLAENTIGIVVPIGTDISDLSIDFAVSDKATIEDPKENEDFTSGENVLVTVIAEDETTNSYLITVEFEEEEEVLSDENLIISVVVKLAETPIVGAEANIDTTLNLIKVVVPNGTPIDALTLDFELSENATLQGGEAITENIDFSEVEMQMFTVVAENLNDEKTYTVEVCVAPITQRQALINMYDSNGFGDPDDEGWDLSEGSDIGLWKGVITNADGNVIGLQNDNTDNPINFNKYIQYLPYLETIDSSDAGDRFLPDEEFEGIVLENIKTISIGDLTGVTEQIPQFIIQQTNLNELNILGMGLVTIQESVSEMSSLEILNVRFNDLVSISESIADLEFLETLDIRNNDGLTTIPQVICDLVNTREGFILIKDDTTLCDGDDTNISIDAQKQALLAMFDETSGANWDFDLPLSEWDNITVDPVTGNVTGFSQSSTTGFKAIDNFDENLGELIYLENLTSNGYELTNGLPDEITSLVNLTNLNLAGSELDSLPDAIGDLERLITLNLSNNSISLLPSTFDKLTQLNFLTLSFNDFTVFPQEIINLNGLQEIYLQFNQITIIPDTIDNLSNLQVLWIWQNSLLEIPEAIASLSGLTNLDIRRNNILLTSIPQSVCDLEITGTEIAKDDTVVCGEISSANQITAITLLDANDVEIETTSIEFVHEVVDNGTNEVNITLPFGTDVTAVKIVAEYSGEVTLGIDPDDINDLSIPGQFTVTAQDGTEREYTITLTVAEFISIEMQRQALLNMYDETRVNEESRWDLNDLTMLSWDGITLDADGNVIGIRIDAEGNGIFILDENLNNLPFLETISLDEAAPDFPELETLINLPNLNSFSVDSTTTSELPDWLLNQESLETLTLKETNINELPENFGDLTGLVSITLSNNGLSELPISIASLENLRSLNIFEEESIEIIPNEICALEVSQELIITKRDTTICEVGLSSENEVLTVSFISEDGTTTFEGIITGITITAEVPLSTDITALKIEATYSAGATSTLDPGDDFDFSTSNGSPGQETLTVTAEDGTEQIYTVTVTKNSTIAEGEAFITTWTGTEVIIPINTTFSYNYNIDWDNDGIIDEFGVTDEISNTYTTEGPHTIQIIGEFPAINFGSEGTGDPSAIVGLEQWGMGEWLSMENAFFSCVNLIVDTTDIPDFSSVKNMESMFRSATQANPNVSNWDVSNVTNMNRMFSGARSANPDVRTWSVSNVTDMTFMFQSTDVANPDVSIWDTRNVTSMNGMFNNTDSANPDVSNWDLSSVITIESIFRSAAVANPDVSNWNISSRVTNIRNMFEGSNITNPDLSNWDISNVTNMSNIFGGVTLAMEIYDQVLQDLSTKERNNNIEFGGGFSTYCNEEARNALEATGWIITDGGLDTSCAVDLSSKNQIIELTFVADGTTFEGVITGTTITAEVPFSTDLTALSIQVVLSDEATSNIDPDDSYDFDTGGETFTVFAEDETEQIYTVSITKAAITQREALLSMYDESSNQWDLTSDWNTWSGVTAVGDSVTALRFDEDDADFFALNENLGILTDLEIISIQGITIPSTIVNTNGGLTSLTDLILEAITFPGDGVIPTWITSTTSLVDLTFDNMINFTEIPTAIGQLTNLDRLRVFDSSTFTTVSNAITSLNSLETLSFVNNNNLALSQEVCDFGGALTNFDDDGACPLYPPEIQAQRDALLSMYSEGGPLNWSEDTDMSLWNDIELDTEGNVIDLLLIDQFDYVKLNNSLSDLIYLQELTYSENSNSFTSFPNVFTGLTNLRFLNVEQNSIDSLPESISALINLEMIEVTETDIISLPASLCDRFIDGSLTVVKDDGRGEFTCE